MIKYIFKIIMVLVLSVFEFNICSAQMAAVPFISNVTKVTDIQNCGDNRLFIVEQGGKIWISDLQGNLLPKPFLSITAQVNDATTEQGLLGLAFSPSFKTDGRFYVNYTRNTNATVISRFTVSDSDPNIADSINEEILDTIVQPYSNHNGGALQFGPDGYLYIALGDGGAGGDPGERAQDLTTVLGKILRIDVNTINGYSVPVTNPFYGSVNANPLIWAYGLRNPWRISFDKLTGDLWIGDVGQNVWEEIDFQSAASTGGENYGWRCYESNVVFDSTCAFTLNDYVPPVHVYSHFPGCSVTGGYVYRGAKHASWYGKYFFTDYCVGNIQSLAPNDTGGYDLKNYGNFGNYVFSTFGQDRYGELYVGKNTTGVLKLVDSSCVPVAFISEKDTIFNSGSSYTLSTPAAPGLKFQWYLNGKILANEVTSTFVANISGNYRVLVTTADSCHNISKQVTLILGNSEGFAMYPNPAQNSTELIWAEGFPSKKKLEVFDSTGKLCRKVNIQPKEINYILDTASLTKGIYIVRMTINGKVYIKKLMVN